MPRQPSLPFAAYALTLAVCLAFGGVALALGMDANWDLRNYHWYNGWAFAHGLVGRDVLVSQIPSFYNPTIDVPFALLAERLPARVLGFLMGMVHGLNFLPLVAIGWRLLAVTNPHRRLLAAAALALAGVTGAGGLSEVGTVFYDNVISLAVAASALVVVVRWDDLADGRPGAALGWAMLAGLPAGLAFGLKQPSVIFCVGLCFSFLAADMPPARRVWVAFWFGVAVLAGMGITGGHWMLHLWRAYGNPLFPYFNDLFRSPWGLPIPYRDDGYVPKGLVDKLLLPLKLPFDPDLSAEAEFRDFRLAALYLLAPLAGLAALGRAIAHRRRADPLTRPGPTGWLLSASMLTLLVWVMLFSIYRYTIPLEMLAPLAATAAIGLLPLGRAARRGLAAGLVAFLAATTLPADWIRVAWTDRAVEVSVPAVDEPERTLVLMAGHEPLSYLIPAFPRSMRFLRIDSTFTLPDDPERGFRKVFRDAIAGHRGPLASLHLYAQQERDVVPKLAEYGLELDRDSCRDVTSPLGPSPYGFCLIRRRAT